MPVVIDPSAARQNAFNSLNTGLANAQQVQLQRQQLYEQKRAQTWQEINNLALEWTKTRPGAAPTDAFKDPDFIKAMESKAAASGVALFGSPQEGQNFFQRLFGSTKGDTSGNAAGMRTMGHVYTGQAGEQYNLENQAVRGNFTPVQEIVQTAPADDSQYQTLLASLQNGAQGVPQALVKPVAPESTPRAPAPASTAAYQSPRFLNTSGQAAPAGVTALPEPTDEKNIEAYRMMSEEVQRDNDLMYMATIDVQNTMAKENPNINMNDPATQEEFKRRVIDRAIELKNGSQKPEGQSVSDETSGLENATPVQLRSVLDDPQSSDKAKAFALNKLKELEEAQAAPAGNTGAGGVTQPNTATPAGTPDTWDLNAQTEYVQWLSNNAEALGFAPFAMPRTEEAIRRIAAQNAGDATLGKYRVTKGGAIPGSTSSAAASTTATPPTATPPTQSTATATPVDSAGKKLGWTADDESLVRSYLNNPQSLGVQDTRHAEYLLARARTQLTRDAVTETRTSTTWSPNKNADPVLVQRAANFRMMTDPEGVFKDDLQMQHVFTNLAELGIRERKAKLRSEIAAGTLTEMQAQMLERETKASEVLATAEMFQAQSEAAKQLLELGNSQARPYIDAYMESIKSAGNEAERERARDKLFTALSNPQFQSTYDAVKRFYGNTLGYELDFDSFKELQISTWLKRESIDRTDYEGSLLVPPGGANTGVTPEEAANLARQIF